MSNITVLTPAYNRGKLLEKLYESLCAQDCKDFEWLIVDDGSTDDTSERVEQMKQTADFPISYHKKENGGKHTALNYAYQFIKAPLTFIVDSDDSLTVDAISCVNEIYKKYKNESDLCGFSFLRGKPDGGYLSTSGVPQDGMKESYVECRINRNIGGDMAEVWLSLIHISFGKYDVVHIHAEGPAFFAWLPKMFGKRVVVTVHGIDWQREKWQSGLGSKFIHQGEKNAAKYADEVIVLSKGVQDYFKETYGRETHFIPNGCLLYTSRCV